MSIWYQYKVTILAKDGEAISKFFGIEGTPNTGSFGFSFGCKNTPGLDLGQFIVNNPNLILLVNQGIELDHCWFLVRWDQNNKKIQKIRLSGISGFEIYFNKKLVEQYASLWPNLMEEHVKNGYQGFRWPTFFSYFEDAEVCLNKASEYSEIIELVPGEDFDTDFDNDYSHLEETSND